VNYAEWIAKIEELMPDAVIYEEDGEICIRSGLKVDATFDGTDRISASELEIVSLR